MEVECARMLQIDSLEADRRQHLTFENFLDIIDHHVSSSITV